MLSMFINIFNTKKSVIEEDSEVTMIPAGVCKNPLCLNFFPWVVLIRRPSVQEIIAKGKKNLKIHDPNLSASGNKIPAKNK